MWIVTTGKRKDGDLIEPGVAVALQRAVDDRLDRAKTHGPLDHRALTEAALPWAAAHNLNRDTIVYGFDEGNNRLGR